MNIKSGIVMEILNSAVYLMTNDGEFIKVKLNKKESLPIIGSEYSGVVVKNTFVKNNIFKYASVACLMLFMLLGGGGAYAYYKPVSTVTISINPAIELKSNILKKVISATALNGDGKTILQEISLKNKTIDDALFLVVDQAKKDKFIDENYIKNNKTVHISIKGKELALSSFENKISKDDLNVKIDNNGTVIFNKNAKIKSDVAPSNTKINTNNSDKHANDINKKDTSDNLINSTTNSLPAKNTDKQGILNPNTVNNNSNKNKATNTDNKNNDKHINNFNDKGNNYNDIKEKDSEKDKKKDNDYNPDIDSKNKNDKDTKHDGNNTSKNSNDNKNSSEGKNKKDK